MMHPDLIQQMTGIPSGAKKPTHRGHRSRGKGPKVNGHVDAKTHIANAHKATDPAATRMHLFKALSSLKKANTPPPPDASDIPPAGL